jgi:hypothetical protein
MRVFVGYGYNARDKWIEEQVFPVLEGMGFAVAHGKDMQGQKIDAEVTARIDQSDAVVGFYTLRDGQEAAPYNSHMWVHEEVVYAHGKGKTIVAVKEDGVKLAGDGLLGHLQYIPLKQADRLGCVAELVKTLGRRNIRRVRLEPEADELRKGLHQWRKTQGFQVRYRTQDANGLESVYRPGRLELVEQGFYLNLSEIPARAYVEVEGLLNGDTKFSSGWVSADAVLVRIN